MGSSIKAIKYPKTKKGLHRNAAPFKIQYPMKNRYKDKIN